MAFQDVIDDYSNGASGTLATADGSVGYTVYSNVNTLTRTNTYQGAQVSADGSQNVEVTFEQPVVGVTVKFDRSNSGETYNVNIDGVEVDLQTLIDSGDATFTTVIVGTDPVQPGTHVISDGGVTSTGSYDNNSLGFVTFNIPVGTIKVFGSGGTASNWDLIEIGIDSVSSAVMCFVGGTELQTPDGPHNVCDLRAGDRVTTQAGIARTIIAVKARHLRPLDLHRETRLLPIRIAAGALGGGLPTQDLLVSRQHRLLVASRIAQRVCGHHEVLIPAYLLVGLRGITVARAIRTVSYYHIRLACHDIVLANGAPAETLFVGPMSAAVLQDEDDTLLPEVCVSDDQPAMTPARPFVTAKHARKIVAAHLKHHRPVLETLATVCT